MKLEPETVFQYGDQWFRIAEFEPVENAELIIKANRDNPPAGGGEGAGENCRISHDEIKEMFGESMPFAAAKILFPEKSEPLTLDELRFVLRAIAAWNRRSGEGAGVSEAANIADAILRQARRVVAAEKRHTDPGVTTRDEVDMEYASLTRFTLDQFDAALRLVRSRRPALTATQSAPAPGGWREALGFAKDAIENAQEELRMIRMKDSAAVYDTLLRSLTLPLAIQKIDAALSASPAPEPAADAVVEDIVEKTLALSRNYVADHESRPRRVEFANGRVVSVTFDGNLEVSINPASAKPSAQEAPSGAVDALRQINGHIAESAFYSGYVNGITRRELIAWQATLAERQPQPQEWNRVGWIGPDAFERLMRGDSPRETVHAVTNWPNSVALYAAAPLSSQKEGE